MKNYIDSCKKKSAAYLEQNTTHFETVANISIDSDSVTPQKKQKVCEE